MMKLCVKTFSKLRNEKQTFQSSGTKTKLHAKFRDEKYTIALIFYFLL